MKRCRIVAGLLAILVISALLAGCRGQVLQPDKQLVTPPDVNKAYTGHVLQSDTQRVTSPDVNKADLATLVDGNSAFAFNLYQALKETDGNTFYSPYSISAALVMAYAGARDETEQQMAETLHFMLPQNRLHPAFNGLDIQLGSRGQGARGKDNKGFRLHIVNDIWGQEGYQFLPDFLDILAKNYGAGLKILNFREAPDASRETINKWVSDQTEERIKDLIPPELITPDIRFVLTNAIYFNAAWALPFDPKATADGPFHLINGDNVTVPMMKQTDDFGYAKSGNYLVLELPCDGDELSMVILMNETGKFSDFETTLKAPEVKAIISNLTNTRIALTMPKFEFRSEFLLGETLAGMGMPLAFSRDADFSGMTGKRDLKIGEVIHKTFISVDEAGTEAAAATAVTGTIAVGIPPMPPEAVIVTLDRPFVFLIRDIETGAILLIGRVMDPHE